MDRLLDILNIGDGLEFFPHINYKELIVLRQCSKKVNELCKKGSKYVTFYGLEIPTEGRFYNLFHLNYNELEKELREGNDYDIVSRYKSLSGKREPKKCVMPGDIKYNYLWNDMVHLEIAYMLNDEKAINMLIKYGRKTAYQLSGFSSKYKDDSIKLLEKFEEHAIIEKINNSRVIMPTPNPY